MNCKDYPFLRILDLRAIMFSAVNNELVKTCFSESENVSVGFAIMARSYFLKLLNCLLDFGYRIQGKGPI
jgi:hypothetical protein